MKLLNRNFVIFIVFSCCINHGKSFFPKMFNFGPRTSNCNVWSGWSPCFSTASYQFSPWQIPGECYYTSNADYVVNYNGPLLETIYDYYKQINISRYPCGQCLFQISCSRTCDLTNPDRSSVLSAQQNFNPSFVGNPYGISEQLCSGFDQSYACAVSADDAYNRETGECQIWPPLHKDLFSNGLLISKGLKDMLFSMRPNNCISVDKKCFCCCDPYKPDPCTARCTLMPCSNLTVLNQTNMPVGRRRRFSQLGP